MRLHDMAESNLALIRHQHIQVEFDFVRIGLSRESHALSQPSDMPIDTNGRLSKGISS